MYITLAAHYIGVNVLRTAINKTEWGPRESNNATTV